MGDFGLRNILSSFRFRDILGTAGLNLLTKEKAPQSGDVAVEEHEPERVVEDELHRRPSQGQE
jgi:hypothetical protein